jgi:hypothetical protein
VAAGRGCWHQREAFSGHQHAKGFTIMEMSGRHAGGLAAACELTGADGGTLPDNEMAVAERRDTADDQRQGEDLRGQVQCSGLEVLTEQEQSEQAGRQRIEDGKPWLRGSERARRQRKRGQQQGRRLTRSLPPLATTGLQSSAGRSPRTMLATVSISSWVGPLSNHACASPR